MKYIKLVGFFLVLALVVTACSHETGEGEQGEATDAPDVSGQEQVLEGETGTGQEQEVEESEEMSFSLAEVAEHAVVEDCWLVIDGKVYDVTEFVSSHPGGKAIVQGCGQDATDLFETRPMGSGTPHSDQARALLPEYEIGMLAVE